LATSLAASLSDPFASESSSILAALRSLLTTVPGIKNDEIRHIIMTSTIPKPSCWLRVIQINDVYELDNLPHLKTLVTEQQKEGPDGVLVLCAGDFLAPSLLSSLDKGVAMVDCLNCCGVTHFSLGNHEADVTTEALRDRILQQPCNVQWVNTNMRDLDAQLQVETKEYDVVNVTSKQGICKKVALLGLLTHDPGVYRPGAFGGATIEPVLDATATVLAKLPKIDIVIPMTHQDIQDDRTFCEKFGGDVFPYLCGGHDHEVYEEVVNGSRIVKAGLNAFNAAVVDIMWHDDDDKSSIAPTISVKILQCANFPADADLLKRVHGHKQILAELEQAKLFQIANWMTSKHYSSGSNSNDSVSGEKAIPLFSTVDNRLGPSSGTMALCTMLRMGMRSHCAIINAGAVRGNKIYDHEKDEYFTWSNLKSELAFECGMTALYLPGRVLEESIQYSRAGAQQQPPVALGGYLHTCNNIQLSRDGSNKIESIQGQQFDPDKLYLTTLPVSFFAGIDNHKPLLDWAAAELDGAVFTDEMAIPAKMILVELFSASMWLQMGSFEEIDLNKDGVLERDEVKDRLAAVYGHESVADLIVDNIFAVADLNQDGTISPLEMMIVQFVATDIFEHVCTQQELAVMKDVAAQVLGVDPSHDEVEAMVKRIRDVVDAEGDGKVNRSEAMKTLGSLKRSDLLQ
jgi:2',3'-cyclic-nucleotide 2'-phosphodiesterase (5'-nucleotidase family)